MKKTALNIIKRIMSVTICIMMFSSCIEIYASAYNYYSSDINNRNGIVLPDDSFEDIQGDVNYDCYVNCEDALLVLKHVAKIIKLSDSAYNVADMDGDFILTAEDALRILKVSAKIII